MAKKKNELGELVEQEDDIGVFTEASPTDEVVEVGGGIDEKIGGAAEPDRAKRKKVSGNNGP